MKARQGLLLAAKVAVSVALLVFLASKISWPDLRAAIARLGVLDLAMAVGLVGLQCTLLGWRWHRLTVHLGSTLRPWLALKWTLVGIFFNQALPSSVGGCKPGMALGSVLVERISGLVVHAMLVSGAAILLGAQRLGPSTHMLLVAIGPLVLAASAGALALCALASRYWPGRIGNHLETLWQSFNAVLRKPWALLETLLLGALASVATLMAAWVLGRSLGLAAGPEVYMALMGGAMLLAVLPISLGGWGVREATVVALFVQLGAPQEPVLAMSVVWGLLPILLTAPFTAAWWLTRT
jgi:glycosyltransferase 2 family protein